MNNNYYNGGMNMMGGSVYGRVNPIKVTNPLTQEELNTLLKSGGSGFNMNISKEDLARAVCTHKDLKTGQSSAILQQDGSFKCYICGETFNLVENPEMVESITREYLNILQSVKSMYVDIPENVARAFFQIIPLVKQTPELYKLSLNHFNQYDNNGFGGVNTANMNTFNVYSAMAGGMTQGMPMGGMNMGMPMMDPSMGGMMNGMQGQMPMQQGFNPMMQGQMNMGGMPNPNMMNNQMGGPMVNDPTGANINMMNNQMANGQYYQGQQQGQVQDYNPFFAQGGAGYAAGAVGTAGAIQPTQNGQQPPSGISMPSGVTNEVQTSKQMTV